MRRRLPVVAVVLCLLLAAGGARWWFTSAAAARRPHIVVLLWDTARADHTSAFGHARPTTPWLEEVAARGVRFTQARAPSPWTLPSHASLFTGQLPRQHGAEQLDRPLGPAHSTLAERLRAAGYETILASCNPIVSARSGLAQGFDREIELYGRHGSQTVGAAIEALESELATRRNDPDRASRPLFLFVNLMEAHLPYDPPEAALAPWRRGGVDPARERRLRAFDFPDDMAHNLGLRILNEEDLALLGDLYDAELRDLDDGCRRLETLLARDGLVPSGVADGGRPALLVVTSDHGENLGEDGLVDHKLSLGEPLLHIPLVLEGPAPFSGGRQVDAAVRLQDLFPTLLEAAGATWTPAATPWAAPLAPLPEQDRAQHASFPAPTAFIPAMRRFFPDLPARTLRPFRTSLEAVVAPREGAARWKLVRMREQDAVTGRTGAPRERVLELDAGAAGPLPDAVRRRIEGLLDDAQRGLPPRE